MRGVGIGHLETTLLATLLEDTRIAVRQLRRRPAIAVAAVLTLALGTGATAAMFSVVDGVLLKPLPFPDAERLVALCETHQMVERFCVASPPNALDWAERSRTLAGVGVARDWAYHVRTAAGASVSAASGIATPGFFRVLGVRPALGRLPSDEDQAVRRNVVLLAHELWTSAFGSDSSLIGRAITLDGAPFEVIGVLPAGTEVPEHEYVRLWTPLHFDPRDPEQREWRGFLAVGRLAPGVEPGTAEAELSGVQSSLAELYPKTNRGWGVRLVPVRERVVGGVRPVLLLFLGAAAVLLLVACANVANLLLARAAERDREFAVRAALGAGGWRLARLVVLESAVLAAAGGALGLVVSTWGTEAFLALVPQGLPRASSVGVDARVVVAAVSLIALAGFMAGILPALRVMRTDLAGALRRGRQPGAAPGALGVRRAFVAAQVAMAFVLATAAGLLARSYIGYAGWNPGFERGNLLTFWLLASSGTHRSGASVRSLFERVSEDLGAIPGVERVGMASSGPLFGGIETGEFAFPGVEGSSLTARWYDVWPDFHATLGVELKRGRWLTRDDREGAPLVALVNETLARRAWPLADPVGQRLVRKQDGAVLEVVGVVADVAPFTPGQATEPELYWPYLQAPRWGTYVVLRAAGPPMDLLPVVRDRLHAIDADLDPAGAASLEDRVARGLRRPRFTMLLIGAFAGIAVLLGLVGVAGVMAASVAQRTREIGVRLALGARGQDVVGMVVRDGMRLAMAGLGVGVLGALAVVRLARVVLVGVSPVDPVTYAAVAALLAVAALAACAAPALRAGLTDSMEALRAE